MPQEKQLKDMTPEEMQALTVEQLEQLMEGMEAEEYVMLPRFIQEHIDTLMG